MTKWEGRECELSYAISRLLKKLRRPPVGLQAWQQVLSVSFEPSGASSSTHALRKKGSSPRLGPGDGSHMSACWLGTSGTVHSSAMRAPVLRAARADVNTSGKANLERVAARETLWKPLSGIACPLRTHQAS